METDLLAEDATNVLYGPIQSLNGGGGAGKNHTLEQDLVMLYIYTQFYDLGQ